MEIEIILIISKEPFYVTFNLTYETKQCALYQNIILEHFHYKPMLNDNPKNVEDFLIQLFQPMTFVFYLSYPTALYKSYVTLCNFIELKERKMISKVFPLKNHSTLKKSPSYDFDRHNLFRCNGKLFF